MKELCPDGGTPETFVHPPLGNIGGGAASFLSTHVNSRGKQKHFVNLTRINVNRIYVPIFSGPLIVEKDNPNGTFAGEDVQYMDSSYIHELRDNIMLLMDIGEFINDGHSNKVTNAKHNAFCKANLR